MQPSRASCATGDKELVSGAGGVTLRAGPSVEVSGEAITNNRKGKLIPSYELALKGTWSGLDTLLCAVHCTPPCRCKQLRPHAAQRRLRQFLRLRCLRRRGAGRGRAGGRGRLAAALPGG